MTAQKFTLLFFALALALNGCASPPELYPPEETPPYIRQLKSFRLYGNERKLSTGIQLNPGELVTVIASKEHFKGLLVGNIVSLVGRSRELLFWTSSWVRSGLTFVSPEKGRFSFEVTGSFVYWSSFDFFEISVVVWKTDDYGQIAEFLTQLQAAHPSDSGVSDALEQASALKKLQIAALRRTILRDADQSVEAVGAVQRFRHRHDPYHTPATAACCAAISSSDFEIRMKDGRAEIRSA